jgi:thiamine pyrophosphate-dependent acetolactate synthase large subunit-like protein
MTEDQSALTEVALDVVPEETAFVANLGKASFALMNAADRDRNYYMRGAMGSTTSTGLGVAVGTDDPVVVFEGDGSLLMSMGCLSTVGEHGPSNFVVVVWDNQEYATTGGQPTASEETVDFAGVAENCGVAGFRAETAAEFEAALADALETDGPALVAARVETADLEPPDEFDYGCSYVKHRFRSALAED